MNIRGLDALGPEPEPKKVAFVTRKNIEWAIEFTGHPREYIMTELEKAEAEGVLCAVEVRRGT